LSPPKAPSALARSRSARLRAWTRGHGWLVAIAFAYLYIYPYYPKLYSANELPRVYLVKAMVHDQTFTVDGGVVRWGFTPDISESGHHLYSNKSPGSAMLAAPVYAVISAIAGEPSLAVSLWICRITTGVLPTLAFLILLYGFLARFAPDPDVRRLVCVAYALGSMALTYSTLYFSHQLAAVCIGSAWILLLDVLDGKRGLAAMAAVGALAGASPLVDYQAGFAAVPIAIYAVIRLRHDLPRLARLSAVATATAAIPIAILLGYHQACFGSPWRTGYDVSQTFAVYHQQGFLGMTRPRWDAFRGSFVAFDNGLFTLSPWLLLAVAGATELIRRPREPALRGIAITCVAVAGVFALFVSSINFWRGGGAVGPRYITEILPFLLPLVAAQLEAMRARPQLLGAVAGSVIVAVVIYALADATFPYWPESFRNPFRDVTLRLLSEHLAVPSLGSALGLPRVVALVPYLAVVGGVTGWSIWRVAGRRGLELAFVVALTMLAAYLLVPGGQLPRAYDYVHDMATP
jgi:hypothetical protein